MVDKVNFEQGIQAAIELLEELKSQVVILDEMSEMMISTLQSGHKVLTAGNGGSAAEAMHMSEELLGRFRADRVALPAVCLSADGSLLTCIANDYGYDRLFARQIEGLGQAGDLLVVFTTSGNSKNILLAIEAAREKGMRVMALLGKGGGAVAALSDVELIVSGGETERIQEVHQVVLHLLLDAVEKVFVWLSC